MISDQIKNCRYGKNGINPSADQNVYVNPSGECKRYVVQQRILSMHKRKNQCHEGACEAKQRLVTRTKLRLTKSHRQKLIPYRNIPTQKILRLVFTMMSPVAIVPLSSTNWTIM